MFGHFLEPIALSFNISIDRSRENVLGPVQFLFRNQILQSLELLQSTINDLFALSYGLMYLIHRTTNSQSENTMIDEMFVDVGSVLDAWDLVEQILRASRMHALAWSSWGKWRCITEQDPQNVVKFHPGIFVVNWREGNCKLEKLLLISFILFKSTLVNWSRALDCFSLQNFLSFKKYIARSCPWSCLWWFGCTFLDLRDSKARWLSNGDWSFAGRPRTARWSKHSLTLYWAFRCLHFQKLSFWPIKQCWTDLDRFENYLQTWFFTLGPNQVTNRPWYQNPLQKRSTWHRSWGHHS